VSLDVWLKIEDGGGPGRVIVPLRERGVTEELTLSEWEDRFPGEIPQAMYVDKSDQVFSYNITHNLNQMADHAGIYKHLWRPEELQIEIATQLVAPLEKGLAELRDKPDHYRQYNPENGWGDYEGLVKFVEKYLAACKEYPQATIHTWR
jgi:hypothetical protein